MFGAGEMVLLVAVLLGLVFVGVHIAVALGCGAMLGLYLMTGDFQVVMHFIGGTSYEAIRDYAFAVIPLFMLMGEFLARSGIATDLFALVNRVSRMVPGRLAIATVLSNAVFAFISGVSIAAAAAFSRIAYPEMKRWGYSDSIALGSIAGSAILGMLIPPSVLMIIWAILTEISIGDLFLAGVLPGMVLVTLYMIYIGGLATMRPQLFGEHDRSGVAPDGSAELEPENTVSLGKAIFSSCLMMGLVLFTLGGIWFGIFTPTEGAGVAAVGAAALAIARGLRLKEIGEVVIAVGRTVAPLLLLLVAAQLYSRTLSMTGFNRAAQELLLSSGLDPLVVLTLMIVIWLLLGCVLDSISIILLTVPIFAPIAMTLGFDPLVFAIVGIIAIEAGMLTPPFGILVFAVKAAVEDPRIKMGTIFKGSIPYWIAMLILIIVLVAFPIIVTYLPSLLRS